jgi:hypothetical protein
MGNKMVLNVFESIKSINNLPFNNGFECEGDCSECPVGTNDNSCFFVKLNVLISKTRIENVREELFGVKKDV